MTLRQQWGFVGAIVAVLGGGLWAGTHFLGAELRPVTVGSSAPAFRATTLDTTPAVKSLADYRGRVVLLNIWATWCQPCEIEMPYIENLYREMGPKGLAVVAVSIDKPGFDPEIRDFVTRHGLTFEVLHDSTGIIQNQYQTTGVPETFVIGRDGVIRKKEIGARKWDSDANRALIAHLIAEPAH